MIEELEVIPDPTSLIESMRAIGYSVETALADLVDNSISAGSSEIRIEYDASSEAFVAVLDNGRGMAAAELTDAMRHGSRNPNFPREHHDLGRFGLGLKTASLSQCRRLTVVSKQRSEVHARSWDLDYVQQENRWVVIVPKDEACHRLPLYNDLLSLSSGTLVVWQALDKMMSGSSKPQEEMRVRMSGLYHHLGFVFHRFSRKEESFQPINIVVNGLKVVAMDPFLSRNHFRQPLEGQEIRVRDAVINVKPYVLPPISHLTPDEVEIAGGKDGLRGSQGFYIYRNRRLVMWGTWFRLVPKSEFFKLTRVQVDIPNSLDDLWSLDIKKSAAFPPDIIRNRLKDLIPHFVDSSRKTITYPGRKQRNTSFLPLWNRIEPTHETFRYDINVEHPAISSVSEKLDKDGQKKLQALLDLIGTSIPFESIYADMSTDHRGSGEEKEIKELVDIATCILELTGLELEAVLKIDPLARFPQYHDKLVEELSI
ncbi:ATP-binding protein [Mariprofundus erugo]|uniref:ATP-binding protein n=1 Tax=Mariprofundus erugo TaxID=2528639 RepID=A0A5R9GTH8_9PROT|nr:ATP-binding protein [Mariprofundus erugo]TLS68325.1 ATP-binding protein [Mariprofundus erugo]